MPDDNSKQGGAERGASGGRDWEGCWEGEPQKRVLLGQSLSVCHFQEAGMETAVRGMPLEYPPKPERLNAYGNEGRGQVGGEMGEGERRRDGYKEAIKSGMGTCGTRWGPEALERV